MSKIYFFNSHGRRNSINERFELDRSDNNIYISLAYPGYPITTFELLVCLLAFKNENFKEFFQEQINNLDQLETFEELYLFERNIEEEMIQSAWEQTQTNISRNEPDYNLIIKLNRYMTQYLRPDGKINVDLYKINSSFFLTFYFYNDKFNLTLPDYSYSTHIYSKTRVQRSGLNPMDGYNYDLQISSGEKFDCNEQNKRKINNLIKQMYLKSELPTLNELKGRFVIKCIDKKYLAVSEFVIYSTEHFIKRIDQRIGKDRNIIFLANCSTLEDPLIDKNLVRRQSFSFRTENNFIPELEYVPNTKNFPEEEKTTFNLKSSKRGPIPNTISGRIPGPMPGPTPGLMTGPTSDPTPGPIPGLIPGPTPGPTPGLMPGPTPGLIPGPMPGPMRGLIPSSIGDLKQDIEPYNPDLQDEYITTEEHTSSEKKKKKTKIEHYQKKTKDIFRSKIRETKTKTNNIFVSIKSLFTEDSEYSEYLENSVHNYYILSIKTYDSLTIAIIYKGIEYIIQHNIPPTSKQIIKYGLMSFLKNQDFSKYFNSSQKKGYNKAIDFYELYICRLNSNYRNKLLRQFINWIDLTEQLFQVVTNNNVAEQKLDEFVNSMDTNLKVTLDINPTSINYNISRKFRLTDLNTWTGQETGQDPTPINFWFIKTFDDYMLKVIDRLPLNPNPNLNTKSKFLEYKQKYLNSKKNL